MLSIELGRRKVALNSIKASSSHRPFSLNYIRTNTSRIQHRCESTAIEETQTQVASLSDIQLTTSCGDSCKADFYNRDMASKMEWTDPFHYHPERGLYYHEVAPRVFCGTQPRSPTDVETLSSRLGISAILNLQTDSDMQYWGVNVEDVKRSCERLGINHIRRSARDFDPHSLRRTLPGAVKALQEALLRNPTGSVYVHCTAGLGRAPGVCIAHRYWFSSGESSVQLDVAYKQLTEIRPCGPKRDAIRGATFDMMDHRQWHEFDHLPQDAWASLSDEQKAHIQRVIMERN